MLIPNETRMESEEERKYSREFRRTYRGLRIEARMRKAMKKRSTKISTYVKRKSRMTKYIPSYIQDRNSEEEFLKICQIYDKEMMGRMSHQGALKLIYNLHETIFGMGDDTVDLDRFCNEYQSVVILLLLIQKEPPTSKNFLARLSIDVLFFKIICDHLLEEDVFFGCHPEIRISEEIRVLVEKTKKVGAFLRGPEETVEEEKTRCVEILKKHVQDCEEKMVVVKFGKVLSPTCLLKRLKTLHFSHYFRKLYTNDPSYVVDLSPFVLITAKSKQKEGENRNRKSISITILKDYGKFFLVPFPEFSYDDKFSEEKTTIFQTNTKEEDFCWKFKFEDPVKNGEEKSEKDAPTSTKNIFLSPHHDLVTSALSVLQTFLHDSDEIEGVESIIDPLLNLAPCYCGSATCSVESQIPKLLEVFSKKGGCKVVVSRFLQMVQRLGQLKSHPHPFFLMAKFILSFFEKRHSTWSGFIEGTLLLREEILKDDLILLDKISSIIEDIFMKSNNSMTERFRILVEEKLVSIPIKLYDVLVDDRLGKEDSDEKIKRYKIKFWKKFKKLGNMVFLGVENNNTTPKKGILFEMSEESKQKRNRSKTPKKDFSNTWHCGRPLVQRWISILCQIDEVTEEDLKPLLLKCLLDFKQLFSWKTSDVIRGENMKCVFTSLSQFAWRRNGLRIHIIRKYFRPLVEQGFDRNNWPEMIQPFRLYENEGREGHLIWNSSETIILAQLCEFVRDCMSEKKKTVCKTLIETLFFEDEGKFFVRTLKKFLLLKGAFGKAIFGDLEMPYRRIGSTRKRTGLSETDLREDPRDFITSLIDRLLLALSMLETQPGDIWHELNVFLVAVTSILEKETHLIDVRKYNSPRQKNDDKKTDESQKPEDIRSVLLNCIFTIEQKWFLYHHGWKKEQNRVRRTGVYSSSLPESLLSSCPELSFPTDTLVKIFDDKNISFRKKYQDEEIIEMKLLVMRYILLTTPEEAEKCFLKLKHFPSFLNEFFEIFVPVVIHRVHLFPILHCLVESNPQLLVIQNGEYFRILMNELLCNQKKNVEWTERIFKVTKDVFVSVQKFELWDNFPKIADVYVNCVLKLINKLRFCQELSFRVAEETYSERRKVKLTTAEKQRIRILQDGRIVRVLINLFDLLRENFEMEKFCSMLVLDKKNKSFSDLLDILSDFCTCLMIKQSLLEEQFGKEGVEVGERVCRVCTKIISEKRIYEYLTIFDSSAFESLSIFHERQGHGEEWRRVVKKFCEDKWEIDKKWCDEATYTMLRKKKLNNKNRPENYLLEHFTSHFTKQQAHEAEKESEKKRKTLVVENSEEDSENKKSEKREENIEFPMKEMEEMWGLTDSSFETVKKDESFVEVENTPQNDLFDFSSDNMPSWDDGETESVFVFGDEKKEEKSKSKSKSSKNGDGWGDWP